jgi:hypothetical protein
MGNLRYNIGLKNPNSKLEDLNILFQIKELT